MECLSPVIQLSVSTNQKFSSVVRDPFSCERLQTIDLDEHSYREVVIKFYRGINTNAGMHLLSSVIILH